MREGGIMLSVEDVNKSYPSAGDNSIDVLKDIDISVESGETLAVTGPSGSGKSTLLNLMGALDRPDSGRIMFDCQDVSLLGERTLARLRNSRIGFVFQQHHLLPQCSALENVLVPSLVNENREGAHERAVDLLERVGLGERMDHRPGRLSGGECQRAAVVRALINKPRILLADEPAGSLDEKGAADLCDLLLELNRESGVAVVMATHSEKLAGRMGRILEIHEGVMREKTVAATD